MQAAFQELLPLCARIIPHWQQHADTPEGRQAAYLHMYKWRSSWKEGVHAGPQCSFADWDGDASDPVNFPMAAAAAAEPSPLAKFQVWPGSMRKCCVYQSVHFCGDQVPAHAMIMYSSIAVHCCRVQVSCSPQDVRIGTASLWTIPQSMVSSEKDCALS